jgi:hypothetical protein
MWPLLCLHRLEESWEERAGPCDTPSATDASENPRNANTSLTTHHITRALPSSAPLPTLTRTPGSAADMPV